MGESLKSASWKDIAEFVGIAAIVASLIFVGIELQQSREIAIADIYQQRTAMIIDANTIQLTSDSVQHVLRKYRAGDPLSDDEKYLMEQWFDPFLNYWENNHFQYQKGLLSSEQWISSRNTIRNFARNHIFVEMWNRERDTWRESFAEEVDAAIQEAASLTN